MEGAMDNRSASAARLNTPDLRLELVERLALEHDLD